MRTPPTQFRSQAALNKRSQHVAASIRFSAQEMRAFRRVHGWLVRQGVQATPRPAAHLNKTEDALVLDLVSQMAVIGNSEPGQRVRTDPRIAKLLRWRQNLDVMSLAARARVIHRALRMAGARFAGKSLATCPYSKRLSESLNAMSAEGGPRAWAGMLANLPTEAERVNKLRDLPVFRGQKSPRDFLSTKLGLARDLIALDIRIMQVLRTIAPTKIQGATTPGRRTYEAIEKALVEQVAPALGCTPYELDQLLYLGNKDNAIVKYLTRAPVAKRADPAVRRPRTCS